jgi:hypothetical protein
MELVYLITLQLKRKRAYASTATNGEHGRECTGTFFTLKSHFITLEAQNSGNSLQLAAVLLFIEKGVL